MPNRILRDAILTSAPVCSLGWPEEVFYRRLMSIVDDFGRCESFPQLLRSRCYPLQTDQVRVADISRWLAACQKAGLLVLYAVDGKEYLQIEKFGQQQRSTSKYPQPPASASNCLQPPADAHLGVFVSEVVSEVVSEGEKARKRATPSRPDDVCEQVWDDWLALRKAKRAPVSETVLRSARAESAKAGVTFEHFLVLWCARGSQGLEAAWLTPAEHGMTARQRDAADRAAELRAMTGGILGNTRPATPLVEVFDVTPRRIA